MNTNENPKKKKKAWQKPEIYLLDTNAVNNKSFPYVREATGHQTNIGGALFWVKASKNATNASVGNGSFKYLVS